MELLETLKKTLEVIDETTRQIHLEALRAMAQTLGDDFTHIVASNNPLFALRDVLPAGGQTFMGRPVVHAKGVKDDVVVFMDGFTPVGAFVALKEDTKHLSAIRRKEP